MNFQRQDPTLSSKGVAPVAGLTTLPSSVSRRYSEFMEHGAYKDFHEAATSGHLDVVKYYVQSGVDIDYIHPEFISTALVSSILAGQEEVALYLLEHGADPELTSPLDELTPMEAAHQAGMLRVQERLENT